MFRIADQFYAWLRPCHSWQRAANATTIRPKKSPPPFFDSTFPSFPRVFSLFPKMFHHFPKFPTIFHYFPNIFHHFPSFPNIFHQFPSFPNIFQAVFQDFLHFPGSFPRFFRLSWAFFRLSQVTLAWLISPSEELTAPKVQPVRRRKARRSESRSVGL